MLKHSRGFIFALGLTPSFPRVSHSYDEAEEEADEAEAAEKKDN